MGVLWYEVYDDVEKFLGQVVEGSVDNGVSHFRDADMGCGLRWGTRRPNEGESRGVAMRDANFGLTHSSVIPPRLSVRISAARPALCAQRHVYVL